LSLLFLFFSATEGNMIHFNGPAQCLADECESELFTPECAAFQLTVAALDAWGDRPITRRELRFITTRHPNRRMEVG
jgi:hypothetical protein